MSRCRYGAGLVPEFSAVTVTSRPVVGAQPVFRAQLKAERVVRAGRAGQAELDRVGGMRRDPPVRPPGQAVNGVAARGLGDVKLIRAAVDGVAALVDAVRPGREQLARASRGQFVRSIVRMTGRSFRLSARKPAPSSVTVA